MAIVQTDTIGYKEGEFVRKIRVLKDGLFRIKLPPFTETKLSYDEVFADTKREAIKKYDQGIKEYQESITVSRKVIIYSVGYSAEIWGDPKLRKDYNPEKFKGYDKVVILTTRHNYRGGGMGITIKAGVFIENRIDHKDKPTYKYDLVGGEEGLPSGLFESGLIPGWNKKAENCIDWTPQRHKFFEAIYNGMCDLIWKLHQLEDEDILTQIADSGKLLIGDGNET